MGSADFIRSLLIHERLSLLDQVHCAIIEKLKVIAGEIDMLPPIATQPPYVLLNAIHILLLLL